MFPSSIRASIAALAVYVVAVSALPSLTLETSTPNANVDGLTNLKVSATTVNTGDETLKLLDDSRGVLSPLPENSTTTDTTGSRPSLGGVMVNYGPTHGDADGTPEDLHTTVERIAEVKFAGDIAVSRSRHEKRADYAGCGKEQRDMIREAAQVAQNMVTATYGYVDGLRESTVRSRKWFGAYTEGRMWKVRDTLWWAKQTQLSAFTFNCTCERIEVDKIVEAYINRQIPRTVWLCPGFWFDNDYIGRAGVLIHELTHFMHVGSTIDAKYGRDASRELAYYYPDWAVLNADSYRFFALDVTA